MVRFVALGDSLTEGTGDPHPLCPNGLRGWADILAAGLAAHDPATRYANLAVHGKRAHEVRDTQLPAAQQLAPTLATVWAGGNDLLRPTMHGPTVMASIEESVGRLRDGGSQVLLLTGMHPPGVPVMRALGGRVRSLNDGMRAIARTCGARVVDVSDAHTWSDARLWAADRVHPSASGHVRLAEVVAEVAGLGQVASWVRAHAPVLAPPARPIQGWRAHVEVEAAWWVRDVIPHCVRWATNASARESAPMKWPDLVRPATAFRWVPANLW